jgi:hypothetical protein
MEPDNEKGRDMPGLSLQRGLYREGSTESALQRGFYGEGFYRVRSRE